MTRRPFPVRVPKKSIVAHFDFYVRSETLG